MAKNYDGLVKGTFPSTTEAAGGAPFALAEVIRGGGTVVVKNDSDRDLLDSRVLDDRMIIWHAADTEYQFYNADGITRDSTGSLAGGTWTKLVLGGETLGALNNVNVMADAPETPPSLNEENQRHLIYDHTIKEWTPAREVIILDGIATLDSDLVITYPNFAQNVETIIPLVNTTGIMKGATESGDLYYDTDDNTITLNTEVGINATVSFQGFNYVVNTGSSSASYSTTGIDFQILRPNETEWVTLNTGKSTQLVIATLVSTIGTDNFTYDSDFKAGTKFRARSLVTFVSPVPGATLSSTHPSAASIAINGFFGTELEFDSNDVDRRKETQDAFLLYVEGANSSLPSKWVSTRLIEDFTDTDVDGLNVTVSDTDYSFALGRVSSANSDSEVLTTPIGFSNGIDNSNVFIYDPVDLSFEYVGAKDTDVTFTIPSLEVAALITAAQKHRRIFQVSTDAGVTWSVISGSAFDTTAVISINRQTISYAGGTVTHKAFRGYKYRLAFEFHRVETLASAILYSGIIPGTTQLTATGSYHILTGGFASQEYVDSQIGLLDKKRQDSDADIVTAYTAADTAITTAYTAADTAITTAYKAADTELKTNLNARIDSEIIVLDSEIKAYANDITFDFVNQGSWNWTGNVSSNAAGAAYFVPSGSNFILSISTTDANGNTVTTADFDSEYFQISNSIVKRITNPVSVLGLIVFNVSTVLNPLTNLANGTYVISSSDHIQTYTAGLGLTLDTENVFRVDTEVIADTDYVKQYVADHANVGHEDTEGFGIIIDQTDPMDTSFAVDSDVIATRTYAEEQDAFRGLSGLILGGSIHKTYGNDNFRPFTVNTDVFADPAANQVIVNELSNQYVLTVRREDLNKKGLASSADIVQINTANNADYSVYKVLDTNTGDGTHYVYSLSKYTIDGRTDRLDTIVNGATINMTTNSGDVLSLDLVPSPDADVDFNGQAITNIVNGTTDTDVVNKGYVDTFGIQDKTYIIFFSGIEQNSPVNNNEVSVGDLVNDLRFVEFADTSIDLTLSSYYGIRTGTDIGYYFLDHVLHTPNGLTRNDGYFRFLVGTDTLATVEDSDAIIFARAGEVHPTQYNTFTTGSSGLVPGPVAADVTNNRILRADGSWIDDVDNDTHYAAGLGLTEFNETYAVDQSFVATVDYVNGKIANNNLVFNSASPNAISDVLDTDDHVVASLPDINSTRIHLQSGPKSGIEYFPLARTLGQINFTGDTETFTDILKPDVFGTVDSAAIRWNGSPSDVIIDTDHSFSMRLAAVNGNSSTDIDTTAFTIQLVLKVFSGNDGDYTDGGSTIYGITHTVAPFQVQPLDTENIDFDFNIKQILDSDSHNKISNTQVIVPYFIVDYGTEVNWSLISGQSITLTPGHDATKRSLRFGVHHPRVISSLSIDTDTGLNITDSDGNIVSFYDGATKQINRDVRFPWVRGWTFGVDYFVNDLVRAGSKFYECNIAHNSNSSNEPGLSNLGHWVDLSGVKSIAILPDEGLDIFRNDSTGEVDLFLDTEYVKGLIPTELDQSNPKLLLSLLEGSSKTDYVRDAANNNRVTSIGLSTYLEDTATDYRQFFNYNVAGDVTSIEWYDSSSLTKVPANLKITKTFTYNTDGDVTSAIVS